MFIPITYVDGKLLVAVPQEAWHRTLARRLLPKTALQKPSLLEVAIEGRSIDLEDLDGPSTVKIWVGFLSSEMEEAAAPGEPDEDPAIDFGEVDGLPLCPDAVSLIALAADQFSFVSAQSASAGEQRVFKKDEGLGGPSRTPEPLAARVRDIEVTLQGIQQALAALPEQLQKREEKKPCKPEPTVMLPGLDAGVVKSAKDAGISTEQLRRLSVLLQKPNRMQEPASSRPQKRGALSESEEEEEELEQGDGEEEQGAKEPMEKAVLQLTKLVANMSKQRRAGGSLEAILERCDGGSGEPDGDWQRSGGVASKSKASAFKKLKAALAENPEWIYQSVESLMSEDFLQRRSGPGTTEIPVTSRGWLEHRSRLLHYPSAIRSAWIIAGIHDCLKNKKFAEARARASLALAAYDQSSLDSGSWQLAQEFLLELPAPFASFANRRAPDATEQTSSRLIDERILELVMWRLKDRDSFLESKKRLGQNRAKPGGDAWHGTPQPKGAPKSKAKAAAKSAAAKSEETSTAN